MTSRPLIRKSEVAALAATYFALGISVGVVHTNAGTTPWLVIVAAVLVNSASATLSFAAITASGSGIVSGVLGGWLVSTRFGLLAAAVAPRLWPGRGARAAAAFVTFDPNVTLTLYEPADSGTSRRVFVTTSLALALAWWTGSAVSVLIGEHIGDISLLGFDALLPALFIAIIWPRLRERRAALIGSLAAVLALVLVEPLPGAFSLLVATSAALLALLPERTSKPEC